MENYEVFEPIGKGTFGKIYRIKRKSDGKQLVWKEMDYGLMSEKEKQQLVVEVNTLRELQHPNIVKYYDRIVHKHSSKIYIVMEYCSGGDLGQLITKKKKTKSIFEEEEIWRVFSQMVLALYECHKRKDGRIIHRDIKPGNVFLDGSYNVKLGDFGLAKVMGKDSVYANTNAGTPYYMSPEQINEYKYNEKTDIWSAGCVFYEMASLDPPFKATNHLSLALKIKSGKFERIPSKYSEELQRVITWMLSAESENRPSVEDLLNVPEISLRLRERRLKESHATLLEKEAELNELEKSLDLREKAQETRRLELIKATTTVKKAYTTLPNDLKRTKTLEHLKYGKVMHQNKENMGSMCNQSSDKSIHK